MASYQSFLIAPYRSGLNTDTEPWLLPQDAFSDIENGHIHHGYIEKRSGFRQLAQMRHDNGGGPFTATNRILGIYPYYLADGTTETLVFDTRRAGIVDYTNRQINPLDTADIFDSGPFNYIWATNWDVADTDNRLYFTNGKAFDGASLNGIRFYSAPSGGGATTTSFVPDLDGTSTTKLYGAKLLFAFKGRLVCLNTFENDGVSTDNFAQRARWCQAQNPSAWRDDIAGQGSFTDAATGEQIISARALQDAIIVFFTNSVWTLRYTGNPSDTFRWQKINSFRACDGKMASTGYDRYSLSVGVRGIAATDGNDTRRIDERIEDFVSNEVDTDTFGKVFCLRSYTNRRLWILYPSVTEDNPGNAEIDKALIYDDESGSWAKYTISMNVLGYGNLGIDYALNDFVAANDLDINLLEAGNATIQDYFWQDRGEVILGGDIGGFIHIMETDAEDDAEEISFRLNSAAWNPWKDQGVLAELGYIDFYLDTDQVTRLKVKFYKDDDFSSFHEQVVYCFPTEFVIGDITDIQQTNPAEVEVPDHGLTSGAEIYIYGVSGMRTINDGPYTVTVVDGDSITLDGVDATAFDAYTTGGVIVENPIDQTRVWKRAYCGQTGFQHRIEITSEGVQTPLRIHAMDLHMRQTGQRGGQ